MNLPKINLGTRVAPHSNSRGVVETTTQTLGEKVSSPYGVD